MSDISIIGLGRMGSALARALYQSGQAVTVWNRTAAKMQPFANDGAHVASSLSSAIQLSPVTLICIDNYTVTSQLLDTNEIRQILPGQTIVQLSTGTPQEARKSEAWFNKLGAAYIDGAILAGPDSIGKDYATLLFAGKQA